ncbi:hypothetical protein [Neogemmobacter tilapiae]|nr:hypothetical protein [Gemmobacter tilapiae]
MIQKIDIDNDRKLLRPPIVKEIGSTPGEKYLAKLSDYTFLNLWSYPNPYRDQRSKGATEGDGKEICDLLVVCGEHIIIFSEKTNSWPQGDINLSWSRWVKRAIKEAIRQINGAERWIADHPNRIFLDRKCEIPFPIDLPPIENQKIHRVIVAGGAAEECRRFFPNHSGSLALNPKITGDQHFPDDISDAEPFVVGDLDPEGNLIHIFDEISLEIVMGELDTIRDFTDYLMAKERIFRSGNMERVLGEENLLSHYVTNTNPEGNHDFIVDKITGKLDLSKAKYSDLIKNPQYQAKKSADQISYVWDHLILEFTKHMLGGTSMAPPGMDFELRENEIAVRWMALESRFKRRTNGEAIWGALQNGLKEDRFFRLMMSPSGTKESETAFFILTVKYLEWMIDKGGYEKYRMFRSSLMLTYAQATLVKFPHLKRIIGIAMEPPEHENSSEDLIYVEQSAWSDDFLMNLKRDCIHLNVFQKEMAMMEIDDREYPEVKEVLVRKRKMQSMNRADRRRHAAKMRKGRK